ncbi:MAG: Ig-like domain-containing protein [Geminicoccaceae bacterium]
MAENQTSAIDVNATDDSDSEGSGLTYSFSGGADQALFNINASTGLVTFINAPDFENPGDAGGDNVYNIQVTVTDSGGLTDAQDIAVTVTDVAENTAPSINSSAAASVPENQTSAIDVNATDDSDSEGSGLTYSLSGGADQGLFSIDQSTGVVTFDSAPDFENPSDAGGDNVYDVEVTVTDSGGLTDVQDIAITVTDVVENVPPTITSNDAASVAENQTSAIDVQSTDDNDSEGSGLTYSLTGGADQGLFGIDANSGVVTFDSAPDFENPGDAGGDNVYDIQVTVTDSGGLTDVQDIAITVTDVNEAPVANDDGGAGFTTDEDTSLPTATVLDNDSDPEDDTLSVASIDTSGTVGQVTDNGDGTFAYDPNGQFESLGVGESTTDTFDYTVSDGEFSDTATVTITVNGVNDAPVAADDETGTDENTAIVIPATDLVGNDSDVDASDVLAISAVDSSGTTGTVALNADGTVTYDPNGQFESLDDGEQATDGFGYTVSDGNGGTDTAAVTVTITGVNDPPVATDDELGTNEDALLAADLTGNLITDDNGNGVDSDVEGDPLSISAINGDAALVGQAIDLGRGVEITVQTDGSFTITATNPFALNGLAVGQSLGASIDYTLSDGDATDTARALVKITGDDDAPVINEVDADTPSGADRSEFIELFDVDGGSLDGTSLVVYKSNGDRVDQAFDLDGQTIGQGDFFVLGSDDVVNVDLTPAGFDVNELDNTVTGIALVQGDAADFPIDQSINALDLADVIDAVVYEVDSSTDPVLGPSLYETFGAQNGQINEDARNAKDTDSVSRQPQNLDAQNAFAWGVGPATPGVENVVATNDVFGV